MLADGDKQTVKVLYVEDSPSDVDFTRRALGRSAPDVEIEIVGTVAAALARLGDLEAAIARGETPPFDLVLLDMNLPDGNGLSVLAEVRHRSLPLAVVVLTGSGDEASVLAALRAGADDYLPKGHDYWTHLSATLRAALAKFRSLVVRHARPLRLLYVEPHQHDIHLTRLHLIAHASFIHLEVVHTAEQALERLPQSGPVADVDVILLDYRLTGMNALDALKEILDVRGLDVPVILTTGQGSEDVALQALKLGAADYIVKSAGYLDRLSLAVENVFYRAQSTREHAALREERARLAGLIDSAMDAVITVDSAQRITLFNPAAEKMFGYTAEQMIGQPIERLIPERHRAGHSDHIRNFGRMGVSTRQMGALGAVSGVRADGEEFPLEAAISQVEVDGRKYYTAILRDITERKRAEEGLLRFRMAMETTLDGIFLLDFETFRYLDVNETGCRMLGYSRDELLTMRTMDTNPNITEAEQRRRFEEARALGSDHVMTVPEGRIMRRKDGSTFPIEGARRYLRVGDKEIVVGIARDVTERKQIEGEIRETKNFLASIFDNIPNSIFIKDARDLRFVRVNAACEKLTGYSEKEFLGKSDYDFFPKEQAEFFVAKDRETLAGNQRVFIVEESITSKDGTEKILQTKKFPILDKDGHPKFLLGMSEDITERKHADRQLQESEAKYRQLIEQASDGIFLSDAEGNYLLVNSRGRELLGYAEDELVGMNAKKTYLEEEWEIHTERLEQIRSGQTLRFERMVKRKDGSKFPAEISLKMLDTGTVQAIFHDISTRHEQEQKIGRLSRIHAVLSGINSAIVRIRDRRELFEEACRIAVAHGGFSIGWIAMLDHVSGKLVSVAQAGLPIDFGAGGDSSNRPVGLVPGGTAEVALRENRPAFDNDIERGLREMGSEVEQDTLSVRRAAIRLGAKSVIVLPLIVEGKTFGVLTLYAPERNFFDDEELKLLNELAGDISFGLEFMAKEEKVDYLAYYDTLTGLPNRSLFFDRLTHQLGTAARGRSNVALVLMDLDRFRLINDSLGRQAGDALIAAVAQRIKETFRDQDTVARVGADSFAVAVSGTWRATDAARVLETHNLQLFGRPFVLGKEELRVSATTGVAVFPGDGDNPETLFANAEAALRKAKEENARFLFYSPEMNARVADSLRLENRLRQALDNGEMVLWYQPKVSVSTRKIIGFEALMRWQDPETGMVPPAKFIPLMEQTGLILEAGRWALSQVARDCQSWVNNGVKPPRVAVNVSPIQLRQKDFVATVVEAAEKTEEAGSMLDLEITESTIMENVETIIPKLQTIRGLGVEIAVDDFGTGYSSLAYIARLPIHDLKIDRSFVVGMTHNEDSLTIVRSIISLAHSLRLIVVAEGVETEEQAALLLQLDCDQMQGYLISRPVPPEHVQELLRKQVQLAPDNPPKQISASTKKSGGRKKNAKRR